MLAKQCSQLRAEVARLQSDAILASARTADLQLSVHEMQLRIENEAAEQERMRQEKVQLRREIVQSLEQMGTPQQVPTPQHRIIGVLLLQTVLLCLSLPADTQRVTLQH